MSIGTAPWKNFCIGKPSTTPNWTNPGCQPLSDVAHVMHTPVALRVLEDRMLRAGLVFDEGIALRLPSATKLRKGPCQLERE